MSEISLMPSSYKGQVDKKKIYDIFILAGITLVLSLFMIYGLISLVRVVYEKELAALQAERKQVENRIGSLGEYEKALRSISEYEMLVKEAKRPLPVWEDVLAEVSSFLPHGIWFDNVDLKYENSGGKCEIAGRALGKDIVVAWLKEIEESQRFRNVELKYIGDNEEEGRKTTMFIAVMEVIPGEG